MPDAITEPFQYARLSCVYYSTTPRADGFYRAADATNAIYAHKAFYDGFKDAGLIVDDDWMHLELGIQRVGIAGEIAFALRRDHILRGLDLFPPAPKTTHHAVKAR